MEDVIEELIGEEIVDETDVFVDVHKYNITSKHTNIYHPFCRRIAVARARLQFTRQSVSAPPIGTHPLNRLRQPWHRSMSEDSQPASSSQVSGDIGMSNYIIGYNSILERNIFSKSSSVHSGRGRGGGKVISDHTHYKCSNEKRGINSEWSRMGR